MLKAIAVSDVLKSIVQSFMAGFCYDEVYEEAFIKADDEISGKYIPPKELKDQMALTFSVLLKIDDGSIEISKLMKNYFYADGSLTGEYNLFLTSFIKPFVISLKTLGSKVITGEIENPEKIFFVSVKTRTIPETDAIEKELCKKLLSLIYEDKSRILASGMIESRLKEALLLISFFEAAIEDGKKDGVILAFTAYKYFAVSYKRLCHNFSVIEENLKSAGII